MIKHDQTGSRALRWPYLLATGLLSLQLAAGGPPSAHAGDAGGKTFVSPEQATDALAAAWHSGATADLIEVFGPAGEKLVNSGDPIAEKAAREKLAVSYDKRHQIENEGDSKATLVIGDESWPYPIPLVKQVSGWQFDVKAGVEQILDRRIGRNELNAIKVCRAYVEAQQDYATQSAVGDSIPEYAQKMVSADGKHDGLYWRASGSDKESPLGPLVAVAEARGYSAASGEGRAPFQGYYYRILTQQGDHVASGAKSYVVDGHMTGGFALIAFPAKYGRSGVMTFVVNQNGIVFEKNLGPDTADVAGRITAYNPDDSWKIAGQ